MKLYLDPGTIDFGARVVGIPGSSKSVRLRGNLGDVHYGHYATLGVARGATSGEIKTAYRRLARANHPDHHPQDLDAESRFKEIQNAYDILENEESRRLYNDISRPPISIQPPSGRWWQVTGRRNGADADTIAEFDFLPTADGLLAAGSYSDVVIVACGEQRIELLIKQTLIKVVPHDRVGHPPSPEPDAPATERAREPEPPASRPGRASPADLAPSPLATAPPTSKPRSPSLVLWSLGAVVLALTVGFLIASLKDNDEGEVSSDVLAAAAAEQGVHWAIDAKSLDGALSDVSSSTTPSIYLTDTTLMSVSSEDAWQVEAIDATTGRYLWDALFGSSCSLCTLTFVGEAAGYLWFTEECTTYRLDRSTGEVATSFGTCLTEVYGEVGIASTVSGDTFYSLPSLAHGKPPRRSYVDIGGLDHAVSISLRRPNATAIWRQTIRDIDYPRLVGRNKRTIVIEAIFRYLMPQQHIRLIGFNAATGENLWTTKVPSSDFEVSVGARHWLLVQADSGRLFELDTLTGDIDHVADFSSLENMVVRQNTALVEIDGRVLVLDLETNAEADLTSLGLGSIIAANEQRVIVADGAILKSVAWSQPN